MLGYLVVGTYNLVERIISIQAVVCGVYPGKSFSGVGVHSSQTTVFRGHIVLPFQRVKERLGTGVSKNDKVIKNVLVELCSEE